MLGVLRSPNLLLAPRAPVHLSEPVHLLLVAALFAMGVATLFAAGQPTLGLALAVLFVVNHVLLLSGGNRQRLL